jgi:hypothetical protein
MNCCPCSESARFLLLYLWVSNPLFGVTLTVVFASLCVVVVKRVRTVRRRRAMRQRLIDLQELVVANAASSAEAKRRQNLMRANREHHLIALVCSFVERYCKRWGVEPLSTEHYMCSLFEVVARGVKSESYMQDIVTALKDCNMLDLSMLVGNA